MALRKITKAAGHWLAGTILKVDSEIQFDTTSNPELDTTGGSFIWKLITATASAWKLRDDTKAQDIITIDSSADTITANSTDYSFVGFGAKQMIATAQSTNYNAANGDFVLMTAGASDKTVTLPAVASSTDAIIEIKKVDSGAGNVIIDGNLSETIDGATTQTISAQYTSITVHCDGTEWWIK
jgi:hypothetical protein